MRLKPSFVLVLSSLWLCACSEDTTEVDNQRVAIERYVTGQAWENVDFLGGVYRYVLNQEREGYEAATQAQRGDKLVINYSVYEFSSSAAGGEGTLIYTNNPEIQNAQEGLDPAYWAKVPLEVELGRTPLISGLDRGLDGVRQGDTLKLFMSSDMGYGDKPFGVIAADTPLVWNLGIKEVIK